MESLKRCLEYCPELGVNIVSVFAFSIENFNREKDEVDYIMELIKVNLLEMAKEG